MNDTIPQIFQDYSHEFIGLPYSAYDCYELVRLFYRKIFNTDFDLYEYGDPLDKSVTSKVIDAARHKYKKVTNPSFGDIILIRENGLPSHLGIYINDVYFLHTTRDTGCILDRLAFYQYKIEGIYWHDKS